MDNSNNNRIYCIHVFNQFAICVYAVNMTKDQNNIDFVFILYLCCLNFYEDFVHVLSALIWETILELIYV